MKEFQRDFYAQKALKLMQDKHKSLLLTGKAGTGKSTLIKEFIAHSKKNLLLLAPTGISAINI
ncbi:MAG: AAA family ATPase [bacterium]|nr:AAA family ATPase [bacterium]